MAKIEKEDKSRLRPAVGGVIALMIVIAMSSLMVQMAGAAQNRYCCPYCGACFPTFNQLVEHVQTAHPGERIPIQIIWT